MAANHFENLQIVFEVGDKFRLEIFGGQFFGFFFFQQPLDSLLIVGFEQLENFADMFFTDKDMAFVKLRNDTLVSENEAPKRRAERGEAAFQPLHRENFHELGEVALALEFLLVAVARAIGERFIASVFELMGQQTNCFVENLVFNFVKFVEQRFGIGDFGEFQTLFFQIFAVVFINFCASAANHQKFENFFACGTGIFLNGLEILLAVLLPV